MHVLGMTSAVRSRGRKAQGYVPVKTVADVKRMVIDDFLRRNKGSVEEKEKINRKTHRP